MADYIFWEGDMKDPETGEYGGVIIPAAEIYEGVSTFEFDFVMFPSINGDENKSKFQIPEGFAESQPSREDILEMLTKLVGEAPEEITEEYEEARNILCFDIDDLSFFSLDDCETENCHSYWRGANYTTVTEGDDTAYEVEFLTSYALDILDYKGNFYYPEGSTGNHAFLRKALVDGTDLKLFWQEWSQWGGEELDKGFFLTEEKALSLLKDHPGIDEIKMWIDKRVE